MPAEDPQRILIVDDEPEVRTLLRTGLEGEGFAVIEAADGRQAMAMMDSQRGELIGGRLGNVAARAYLH